ncbi:WD40-repeat-containing domain protein [Cladochytrium replicatum]|nr:WD40-repeat-containing domain protein [Cladochytrium replicatum]
MAPGWSIVWSTVSPRFLVGGTDLRLYEYEPKNESQPVRLVSVNSNFKAVKCFAWSSHNEDHVAVGYGNGKTSVISLSRFTKFSGYNELSQIKAGEDTSSLGDFLPRHTRTCNTVAFSPFDRRYLASGLEKVRSEPALLIWDMNRIDSGNGSGDSIKPSSSVPLSSFGQSDWVLSTSWFRESPRLVAAMANKYIRIYDIRDGNRSGGISIATNATAAIATDPFHSHRFASIAPDDNIIRIWDDRKTKGPVLRIDSKFSGRLTSIHWSPNQRGLIASLDEGSIVKVFHLDDAFDIYSSAPSSHVTTSATFLETSRSSSLSRIPSFGTAAEIFSAPPVLAPIPIPGADAGGRSTSRSGKNSVGSQVPRLATSSASIYRDGEFFSIPSSSADGDESVKENPSSSAILRKTQQFRLSESNALAMNFIPAYNGHRSHVISFHQVNRFESRFEIREVVESSSFWWLPQGRLTIPRQSFTAEFGDTSENLGNRSNQPIKDTGRELPELNTVLDEDISVTMRKRAKLGYGMEAQENLRIIGGVNQPLQNLWSWLSYITSKEIYGAPLLGIFEILQQMTRQIPSSNNAFVKLGQFPSANGASDEYRKRALDCLGTDMAGDLEESLQRLETRKSFAKAAGWAIFYRADFDRAITILSRSEDSQHSRVATALADFSNNPSNPRQDLFDDPENDLDDAYLRAIFALIGSNGDWNSVVAETKLPLTDRLGVALRYLSDQDLNSFVSNAMDDAVQSGDIEGLLLTGASKASVSLIEAYIDRTGDIQSASVASSVLEIKSNRVDEWVENYRDLLDRWELYHARARFDISRRKTMRTYNQVPPQIYVRCNFCNHPIYSNGDESHDSSNTGNKKSSFSGQIAGGLASVGRIKETSCPTCKKPLPKCALCLLSVGSPPETLRYYTQSKNGFAEGLGMWYTWCQTCRHGGHAVHILDWFEEHTICPVSDCSCQCAILQNN